MCWNWEAYCTPNGYGRFNLNGDIKGAHQVAWMLQHKKKIPYGLCVLHKCDNPSCVNPKHLYLGDQKQNALDRRTRGREGDHKGIKNGRAKLNEQDVRRIRLMKGTYSKIAKIFKVTPEMISLIKRNLAWQHIGE